MKDCTVRIENRTRQKVWTYSMEEFQAIKVYEFIQKLRDERQQQGSRGTLAAFYED